MKLTLGKKLFIYTSGSLVILLLATFLLLEKSQSRQWEDHFKSQAVSFARFATPELLKVFRGDFSLSHDVEKTLNDILGGNRDLIGFLIYSPSAKLLFRSSESSGFEEISPSDLEGFEIIASLHSHEVMAKTRVLADGRRLLDLFSPAFGPTGEQILTVRYLVSFDSLDARLREVRIQFLKVAFFAVLSSAALVAFVARRVTRPIKLLTDGVRAVGREELQTRIGIKSRDEIGALAKAFNEMAQNLDSSRLELTGKNEALSKANEELQRIQEQLVRSERLATIGQLAAGVSHEIDNPVGIILGYAELLLEDLCRDDPRRDDVMAIIEECKRCKRITGGLLGLARSSAVAREHLSLTSLAEEVIHSLRPQKIFRQIDLSLKASKDVKIDANPDQIRQILVNLLLNSAQAMEGRGEIVLEIVREGETGLLLVRDTGPGVSEEMKTRIFDPFFSTKPKGEGTGLGLSVCRKLVEEHDGRISVESPLAGGALFKIEFPLKMR